MIALQAKRDILERRADAVKYYFLCEEKMGPAAKAFTAAHPDHNPTTVQSFIRRWVDHFREHFSLLDRPRSGRKRLITPEQAMQAALEFGSDRYITVDEAIEQNEFLMRLIAESKASKQTLLRSMQEANPLLKKSHAVRRKKALNTDEKKARCDMAHKFLKELTAEKLNRIVWLDAKTILVKRGEVLSETVWGMEGFTDEDELVYKMKNLSCDSIKLKYYSGVNAVTGPVFIRFINGTTDYYCKEILKSLVVSAVCDLTTPTQQHTSHTLPHSPAAIKP